MAQIQGRWTCRNCVWLLREPDTLLLLETHWIASTPLTMVVIHRPLHTAHGTR